LLRFRNDFFVFPLDIHLSWDSTDGKKWSVDRVPAASGKIENAHGGLESQPSGTKKFGGVLERILVVSNSAHQNLGQSRSVNHAPTGGLTTS
jgi:hypothetical protein